MVNKEERIRWNYYRGILFLALPVLLAVGPEPAWSRENILSGSFGLRQEYDSNIHLTATDRRSSWYTVLAPGFLYRSRAPKNQFQLGYNLGFRHNHTTGGESLEHNLLLQGDAEFSPRWQAGIMNRFYLSDDSDFAGDPIPDVDPELSPRRERERFRLNVFSVHSDYQFSRHGTLNLGYDNRILRNKAGTRDDYIRHHPNVTVGYQLSKRWATEVGYGYIRGDFDQGDDLETHAADLRMIYQHSHQSQFSVSYGYNQTDYRGETPDYRLHSANGNWTRHLDPHTTMAVTVGGTRVKRANREDSDFLAGSAELTREFQRGSISLGGSAGVEEMQFTGGDEGDLSRFRQVRISGNRQLLERLRGDVRLSWRQNDFIDRPVANRERIYDAGCGLAYILGQGYELSTRYRFRELDVRDGDGYEDHRVYLELSFVRDFFKW